MKKIKKTREKIACYLKSDILENKNTQTQNFYGVGGMKIFRYLIYGMREKNMPYRTMLEKIIGEHKKPCLT